MVERLRLTLLSWPFLVALATLLLNDHYLKAAYPGFVSGKLSDLAGIFGAGLLCFAARADRPWLMSAILFALFLWWKSPASQPFIDAAISLGYPRIGRTVDYTDLGAFIVLPLAWHAAEQIGRLQVIDARLRRLAAGPVLVTVALAVAATSPLPVTIWQSEWLIRPGKTTPPFHRPDVTQAIHAVAEKYDLKTKDWKPDADRVHYTRRLITLRYEFRPDGAVAFTLTGESDTGFFFTDNNEKIMAELRAEVRREFRRRFGDVDYSESPTTERSRYQ